MPILLSKIAAYFASPIGVILALVLLGVILRLTGRTRIPRALFGMALGILLIASTPKVAGLLAGHLEQQYPPVSVADLGQADIAVMLGGALAPPKTPRLQIEMVDSSDRMLHILRLFRAAKAKRFYLSGGNVFDGYLPYSESEYARALLVDWGIPAARIEIGADSKTTYENAIETRRYLTEKGLINKPVILVTSALHMPRAVETFRAASIRVIPAATDIQVTDATAPLLFDYLPSVGALGLTSRAWHEIVGIWYYRLRGWATPSSLR